MLHKMVITGAYYTFIITLLGTAVHDCKCRGFIVDIKWLVQSCRAVERVALASDLDSVTERADAYSHCSIVGHEVHTYTRASHACVLRYADPTCGLVARIYGFAARLAFSLRFIQAGAIPPV